MWSNTPNFMGNAPRQRLAPFRAGPPADAPGPTIARLAPLDFLDLVGLGPARRHHFDARALALADQRASERRGDGDLAFLGIGLRLAHKLPYLFFLGVLVDQGHRRPERDGVARELRYVDDLGAREFVLEFSDTRLVVRLRLLGGVIFGILRQVAVRARVGNLLDDARPLDLLAVLELLLERRIALCRHRDLAHLFLKPPTSANRQ